MNITAVLAYLVVSSFCLSFFYLFYRLFLRKDTDFKAVRLYLASAVVVSFLLPLTNLQVDLELPSVGTADFFEYQPAAEMEFQEDLAENQPEIISRTATELPEPTVKQTTSSNTPLTLKAIIFGIYLTGFAFLIIRLLRQIISICICYFKSSKERYKSLFIIRNSAFNIPFTFFNWIFIPDNMKPGKEMDDIVHHEMVHARQWHSIDVLVAELLTALMWFNPLIWIMKNSVQLVHEYLADEGALNNGLDKVSYQALLVNQAAEGRLVPLSSRFSQSIIKKRITMMSKTKSKQSSKVKYLGILPVIALLILGIACAKTQKEQELTTENGEQTEGDLLSVVVPVKMNIFYLGVDNPVAVAVSGYKSEELEVRIDNGRIEGQDGIYTVNPARIGYANITISHNGTDIGTKVFRVKPVLDPYARVGEKTGGVITKAELLEAGGINAYVNVEFEIMFKPVSFVISTPISGYMRQEESNSDKFSESQIDLINSLEPDQKLYFEDIKAIGPDGATRLLGPMVFTISE